MCFMHSFRKMQAIFLRNFLPLPLLSHAYLVSFKYTSWIKPPLDRFPLKYCIISRRLQSDPAISHLGSGLQKLWCVAQFSISGPTANTSARLSKLTSHLSRPPHTQIITHIHTHTSATQPPRPGADLICWVQPESSALHLSFIHMMSHRAAALFCEPGAGRFLSAEVEEAATGDTGVRRENDADAEPQVMCFKVDWNK